MKRLMLLLALVLIAYLIYRNWFVSRESSSPPLGPPVVDVLKDAVSRAARDISISGSVSRMVDAWGRHMQDRFYTKEALLSIGRQEFPIIVREMHKRGLYSEQALVNVIRAALQHIRSDSERDVLVEGLLSMRPQYRDQEELTQILSTLRSSAPSNARPSV